ncbi:Beta-glucanase [Drechslerella dactyloides]|uniref:Beta-glucanase n=1 Tax=Drechslerella dactyloides TaxID=74499 RepID=A0AAD6ITQ9_DREDA|nr:Beta-glucanase [Drechslerella dactyloides]
MARLTGAGGALSVHRHPSVWSYEIQVGGFGNGEFDWTTADADNVYVDKNGLRIVPTLTNETTTITNSQLLHGYTLNLTTAGTCTGETIKACGIRSNSTKGTMINPVRSARISTRGKKGIRYGKVEVEAKLPAGDWIWPAIWMLPQDNVYGIWPASGEIDIMESRGNNYDFPQGGVDYFSSALHWGPYAHTDSYLLTSGSTTIRRTDFSKGFYKFGLVWTEDYIVTYLGNRIHQVMYIKFGEEGFWERGDFVKVNATLDANPWRNAKSKAAPFDQEFYLLLNVAVGSTNGYFKDIPAKPWVDGSGTEMRDFWAGVDEWYPTWGPVEERGMTVRSVKMWQQGKCKR